MNYFDFLDQCFYSLLTDMEKENEDLLNVKDKISTLERVKKPIFRVNNVFNIGYPGLDKAKSKADYVRKRIAEKIVRPLLQNNSMDELMAMIDESIRPELCLESNITKQMIEEYGPETEVRRVNMPGYNGSLNFTTCLNAVIKPKYHYYGYYKSADIAERMIDAGFFFAELIIYTEVHKFIETLSNMEAVAILESVPFRKLEMMTLKGLNLNEGDSYSLCRDLAEYSHEISRLLCEFDASLNYEGIYSIYRVGQNAFAKHVSSIFAIWYYIIKKKELPRFTLHVPTTKRDKSSETTYIDFCYLSELFILLLKEYEIDKQEDAYERELSSTCARAFETKKNIPQNVLQAMENSEFNRHYGYVEYDADVDLDKMKVIEQQYLAVSKYLGCTYLEDHSIRFRKLGKHKAAGLYYPTQYCLCVDISSPSSLLHEYFHLLDYTNGRLSRKFDFQTIRNEYADAILKTIKEDPDLEKQLFKKSKFNLSYYLQPTEIFARCGEIYLAKICKIDNSLIKPSMDFSFAYPDSDRLCQLIEEYYTKLLPDTAVLIKK